MSADGSNSRFVTEPSLHLTKDPPVWSPDGRRLAFLATESEQENPKTALYTVAVDGSELRKIHETDVQPAWSPDGTRIAFAVAEDEQVRFYTVNPDGSATAGELRQATRGPCAFPSVQTDMVSGWFKEVRFAEERWRESYLDIKIQESGLYAIKAEAGLDDHRLRRY